MSAALDIPPLYELVSYDTVDSVVDEAKHLAQRGAEEGTLVWARQQTTGRGRGGRPWLSLPGNLYCALILRPEEPAALAVQVSYVAAVSLAAAISNLAPPLIEVRFRWPNDVLLYDAKVAGIWLEAAQPVDDRYEWLVLGMAVNVENAPDDLDPPATSLRLEGAPEVTVSELLEVFCRHFLSWINRWADEGFKPIHRAWSIRPHGRGQPLTLELESEKLRGKFVKLDEQGALHMDLGNRQSRQISVRQFYSI
jgi:BirA family transcriptional regulator, biotin operon repressor / biotin---[acetyl-CoA-carboxylase] ligase